MDYHEENSMFKKWLRKQKLNSLAELYVRHLYFNVGGWEAVHEWLSAKQGVLRTALESGEEITAEDEAPFFQEEHF